MNRKLVCLLLWVAAANFAWAQSGESLRTYTATQSRLGGLQDFNIFTVRYVQAATDSGYRVLVYREFDSSNADDPQLTDRLIGLGYQAELSDTVFHGQYFSYSPKTGELVPSGYYHRGLREGTWTEYETDGRPSDYATYRHGRLHGTVRTAASRHMGESVGRYTNGRRDSTWVIRYANGSIRAVIEYDGPQPTVATYDTLGNRTEEGFTRPDREPVPLNMPEIVQQIGYPPRALRKGIEGSVLVRILISRSGAYERHVLLRSPDPILSQAVEAALPTLRFSPGYLLTLPIRVWVNIPFNFRLERPSTRASPK